VYPVKKIERSANSLVSRARKILKKRNSFLLVFDVKGSRNWHKTLGAEELYKRVDDFCSEINRIFSKNIVSGECSTGLYVRKFSRLVGDGGCGYFDNAAVVGEIISLSKEKLYPIEFWWNVAKDIWDKKNCGIIL
jgi:hypothetical protein